MNKPNSANVSLCFSNCDCPPEYECYKINRNTGACVQLNKEYAKIEKQKKPQEESTTEETENS